MSGQNVNVFISNWQATGSNVPVPQYSVDIAINWKDGSGQLHEHASTYRFPNVLQGVPLARVRVYMEEIILREIRLAQGIDE